MPRMASGDGKTLWATSDRTRFFLIPDASELRSGDFELRDMLGRPRQVDAAAAAAFEITPEQAHQRIREAFGSVLDGVRQVVAELVARGSGAQAAPPSERAERVQQDIDQIKRGVRDLFSSLIAAASRPDTAVADKDVGSPPPSSVSAPMAQAAAVVESGAAAVAEKVKQLLGSPEVAQAVRGAAARLQAIADDLSARSGREKPKA